MAAVKINPADVDIIANELEVRNQIYPSLVTVCLCTTFLACNLLPFVYTPIANSFCFKSYLQYLLLNAAGQEGS